MWEILPLVGSNTADEAYQQNHLEGVHNGRHNNWTPSYCGIIHIKNRRPTAAFSSEGSNTSEENNMISNLFFAKWKDIE